MPWAPCWALSSCCRRVWVSCRSVACGSSVWMSEIHRGILNSTRCWCVGAASHCCPLSVTVGVWTIVSHVGFDTQTSICRCLHPSLYAIEGEGFISRGCLDIPRAGPSFDVLYRARFSTDTLGGLTAVHKFRVKPWDRTKREEREDTDLCLGLGKLSRQCWVCAHALASTTDCSPQRSCCLGRSP